MAALLVARRVFDVKMGLKGINVLVMVAIVSLSLIHLHVAAEGAARSALSKEEDLELEAQLKILNKPPVKTIHTEWGDIFDCIDIYKQPAFDHPLLKNHKIKMKPNLVPRKARDEASSKHKPLSHRTKVEGCPKGTVPIRRTRKEDLIRAKVLSSRTIHAGTKINGPGESLTGLIYNNIGETFYGATAKIDVYNPSPVTQDQYSSAEISLKTGPDDQYNGIHFGWTVNPQLYGDNTTRSFAYWTADGGKTTGCYNTVCPGFVQVHPSITPSSHLPNISVVGGTQYVIQDAVEQDNATGDWWLIYEGHIKVGYWPKALLPLMTAGAEYVYWGGRVKAGGDGVSPKMGSGQVPDDYFNVASFFTNMQYATESLQYIDPNKDHMVEKKDCSRIYELHYYGYVQEFKSHAILYGGPGGKC